jgi:hypothetical protein
MDSSTKSNGWRNTRDAVCHMSYSSMCLETRIKAEKLLMYVVIPNVKRKEYAYFQSHILSSIIQILTHVMKSMNRLF